MVTQDGAGLHVDSRSGLRTALPVIRSRRQPSSHNLHRRAAARTQQRRTRLHPGRNRSRHHLQHDLQQRDQAFAVRMEKAEVARAPKALGQDMQQEQPKEGRAAHRAQRHLAGLAVAVTEADLPLLARQNVLFPNHAPIQIAAQIDQRLLAAAHALAVDDPLVRMPGRQRQALPDQRGQQLGPEHLGQCPVAEQIAVPFDAARLGTPPPLVPIERRCRHHQMHVRVVLQTARMGVQHRHRAGTALQLLVVLAESAYRFPGAFKQQGIQRALMPPGQLPELRRQGEGKHEIVAWHLAPELPLQPLLAFVLLAMRAAAMSAGMRHDALFVTGAAVRQHARRQRGAAALHGREGLALAGQQRVRILLEAVGFEAGNDGSQRNHLTAPHWIEKRCIKALMRVLAASLVWLVRWV
jgi:hypothetical protein